MLKKLSVREVSGEQREFAERTANVAPCKAACRETCHPEAPFYVDEWLYILNVVHFIPLENCW